MSSRMTPTPVTDSNPTEATHGHLIAATKVSGTAVYDLKDERIGRIEDTMLEKSSGRVAYAVLSFGGFLGVGQKFYPMPWASLRYDTRLDGYIVAMDRNTLESAPSFAAGEAVNWADEGFGRRVADHWKIAPYG